MHYTRNAKSLLHGVLPVIRSGRTFRESYLDVILIHVMRYVPSVA